MTLKEMSEKLTPLKHLMQLEQLVDTCGLECVVKSLSALCLCKAAHIEAAHIEADGQDDTLAHSWRTAAQQLHCVADSDAIKRL